MRSLDANQYPTPADDYDAIDVRSSSWKNPAGRLIVCGMLLIAAVVIGTLTIVTEFRERTLKAGTRELQNTVLLLARHFDQLIEDFQVAQQDVERQISAAAIATPEDFRRVMSSESVHRVLTVKVSDTSAGAGLLVFDANGALINSSNWWPVPHLNVADRTYFQIFKLNTEPGPVRVELVRNRLDGQWLITVARRILGPDGVFLGLMTRSITPAAIEKYFSTVVQADGVEISLFHADGTLVAHHPRIESTIGRNSESEPQLESAYPNVSAGSAELGNPIDDQGQLSAALALNNFPLMVTATRTASSALAGWREQMRFLLAGACLSVFAIAFAFFILARQVSHHYKTAKWWLAREKQRLNIAINNMTHGLLLFDPAERLIVCNQRYLDMFGLPHELAWSGCHLRDLLVLRKRHGSFDGDVDEYCATMRHILEKQQVAQKLHAPADGRLIQFQYQPLPDGGWVTTVEDITERRRAEEKIAYLAHRDALTDLPNRVLFREQLGEELRRTAEGLSFALLYLDLDDFKSVNDSLGHQAGDELLKSVADRLRRAVRSGDIVARLGGDEFAIVQTAVVDQRDVLDLLARLLEAIRLPHFCLGHRITADASIGVAMAPKDGDDIDHLLRHADLAMYAAKASGRRTWRFFEPEMEKRAIERLSIEQDLRQIIDGQSFAEGGFELHYQPAVDLHSNVVTGCEALLRWRHPKRGIVSPAEFIPIAEETGLIIGLGEWVLATACAEAAGWPSSVRVAVNVSPAQFRSRTLGLNIVKTLADSGLSPNRLELEITEAVLIRDDESARTTLNELRELGVRIALDDFGTGYSSLSYLQRFPFDKIKIDRAFVTAITDADGSASIVQAVVNIAASRNMTTTAEGVETERQREILRTLGCTEMQGFLFSTAKPAAEVRTLLIAPHADFLAGEVGLVAERRG